jgi:hypothetical protein
MGFTNTDHVLQDFGKPGHGRMLPKQRRGAKSAHFGRVDVVWLGPMCGVGVG